MSVQATFGKWAQIYDRGRRQLVPCFDDFYATVLERMRDDRPAPLTTQLEWLRAAGFDDVDCAYKHYRFAVYSGRKSPLP